MGYLATRDDGSSVAHSPAGRSRHSGYEGDDRLGTFTLQISQINKVGLTGLSLRLTELCSVR